MASALHRNGPHAFLDQEASFSLLNSQLYQKKPKEENHSIKFNKQTLSQREDT